MAARRRCGPRRAPSVARISAGVAGQRRRRVAARAARAPRSAPRPPRARRSRPSASSTAAARRCGAVQIASSSASSDVEERAGALAAAAARSAARAPSASSRVLEQPRPRRAARRRRSARRSRRSSASTASGAATLPGRAQPGQQVAGGAAERGARRRRACPAPRRVSRERHALGALDRQPVGLEHLRAAAAPARPRGRARRCPPGAAPSSHELEQRGADQLRLRALAARLQQPDRAVGRRRAPAPPSNRWRSRWCSAGRASA